MRIMDAYLKVAIVSDVIKWEKSSFIFAHYLNILKKKEKIFIEIFSENSYK